MTAVTSDPIRTLLLNRNTLVRAAFKLLLEEQGEIKVIAETGEEKEAIRLAGEEWPDVILLEPNLEGSHGLEIIPALIAATIQPRIILITDEIDSHYHIEAVQMGAMGVVLKQQTPEVLFKAIEKVHAGEVWLDRYLLAHVLTNISRGRNTGKTDPEAIKIRQLSTREREVIKLIGDGLKNQHIADRMFISEVTVRHHLTSIFKKLGVSDRLELIIYAYRNDLARPPD